MLLVEDNLGDAGLLRAALSEVAGGHFKLTHVERLSQALQRLKEDLFDLILLDLSLPDAHGLDTVARVQQGAPAMPIVVLTGLDDEELAIAAMRQGAQDYLVKGQVDSGMLVRSMRYAIERKRAEKQIQRHQEREAVLHEINIAMTSTLDLRSALDTMLDKISRLLPYPATTVRLLNKENGRLEAVACRNLDEEEWKGLSRDGKTGLTRDVVARRGPVSIPDVQTDPRASQLDFLRKHGLISYLGVPLIVKEELLGVLGFFTRERHQFAHDEIEFLTTLAGQAAIAIYNSRLYEKIKASNEALEKALQVKSVLLGVMSHEIRTPIQVIMGTAGLLAEGLCGGLNDEQIERLRLIETNADDLLRLIQGTLDMTRMEQGKMPILIEEISINALLSELEAEFADSFAEKGIALHVAQCTPAAFIKTDRVKLKEILRNLIDNARKFTQHGKVELECNCRDDDRVEFIVRDTGIGIKQEMLPSVFDLFYQVDSSGQKGSSGAGLGLNIVKRLVELFQGEISVKSEFGQGTTFHVILPLEVSLS